MNKLVIVHPFQRITNLFSNGDHLRFRQSPPCFHRFK